jgi:anti-sigma factor RsiW
MSSLKNNQWQQEAGLRRELGQDEIVELRAYLEAHPEQRREITTDLSLNRILRRLPDQPVSSNFTDQVLQAVAKVQSHESTKTSAPRWSWRRLTHHLPRWAMAGLLIGVGLLSYRQYQLQSRFELARSVMTVSNFSSLAPVEVWENYDAIVRLSHVPVEVDDDLLKALEN